MSRTIGIFGCGTITTEIARAISNHRVPFSLMTLYDRNESRVENVQALFDSHNRPARAQTPEKLLEADFVLEAAGQPAVEEIAVDALAADRDCMLLSVGALADDVLRRNVLEAAEVSDGTLYVPSGAIAGLDAIKASAFTGDLESVSLTTTKPPSGLEGAPYIVENGIVLGSLDEPKTVFEGSAKDAASAFPSNINVAMALSLAGIGPNATTVRIVADPDESNNVHRINASGEMGTIDTTVRNVPSPTNPKTSYLAAVSAIEKLRKIGSNVDVGT